MVDTDRRQWLRPRFRVEGLFGGEHGWGNLGKSDAARLQYESTDLEAPEDEAAAGEHSEEVKLQTQNTAKHVG